MTGHRCDTGHRNDCTGSNEPGQVGSEYPLLTTGWGDSKSSSASLVQRTGVTGPATIIPVTVGPAIPHVEPEIEPPLPTRLRTLADADLEAAKHGSRIQKAAAKAAARAYRLAADMIEEEA